jgi:hypothetical protein
VNEQEALARMVAPGTKRPGKYLSGVIQIHVTRACDKACFGCTQGSNLGGKTHFMSPAQFEQALQSLEGWWGVVGVFGGNPALHPKFETLCDLLCKYFPREQRGLWCNHPAGKAAAMRRTFDPAVSNLNVHLDRDAYEEFKAGWPECRPVGLTDDSRHSPPFVALKDVLRRQCPLCQGTLWAAVNLQDGTARIPCRQCDGRGFIYDEERAWELISNCDINQHWSAMIGVFRGELRAWFCEVAGAQSMLHQDEPNYPDTGIGPLVTYTRLGGDTPGPYRWWELPMRAFSEQVRKHCHSCGIPLRGYGQLAQADDTDPNVHEQVSDTHHAIYKTKRRGRRVELVTTTVQLGGTLARMTDYFGNAKK